MTKSSEPTVIGYFVWWAITNQHILRKDLQELLKRAGIKDARGRDFRIPEVSNRIAFLKAVRKVTTQNKHTGIFIRKIKKDRASYVFGLVDEKVDDHAPVLTYSQNSTMHFQPKTGKLRVSKPHRGFDLIKPLYAEYKDHLNSGDIREIIKTIVYQALGVGVRDRGGIYFIPEKFSDIVEKLGTLVASLPVNTDINYLSVAPQIDTEKTKKAIYRAYIAGLKVKINRFEGDLDEREVHKMNSLRLRIDEFRAVREEIEFYKDNLQFQAEDFSVELAKLTERVTEMINS